MRPESTMSGMRQRVTDPERGSSSEEAPADLLGNVWDALDVLQPSNAARAGGRGPGARQWALAGVIVAACLAAGFVTGTAGRGSGLYSPAETEAVIRHLDILREAGSVAFLEAFASGGFVTPPAALRGWDSPRRPLPDDAASQPDGLREQPGTELAFPQLDAALVDFGRVFRPEEATSSGLTGVEAAAASDVNDIDTEEQRRTFEAHRMSLREMPPSQREDYKLLAEALVDPRRRELVEAAKRWHLWVAFADPVERAGLVDLPTNERLEWLARRQRQWRRFSQPPRGGPEGDRGPGEWSPGRPQGPRPAGGRAGEEPPRRGPFVPPGPDAEVFRGRPGVGGRGAAFNDPPPLP
jgi:hypothetical protein